MYFGSDFKLRICTTKALQFNFTSFVLFSHSSQFPLILQTFASVLLRALDVTSVHSYTTALQGKHRMSSERSGQIILRTALKPRSRVNSMFSRRSQRSHSVNKPLLFLTDATVSKCIDVDLFKKEKKKSINWRVSGEICLTVGTAHGAGASPGRDSWAKRAAL